MGTGEYARTAAAVKNFVMKDCENARNESDEAFRITEFNHMGSIPACQMYFPIAITDCVFELDPRRRRALRLRE